MTRDLGAFQFISREVAGAVLLGAVLLALIFWPFVF